MQTSPGRLHTRRAECCRVKLVSRLRHPGEQRKQPPQFKDA